MHTRFDTDTDTLLATVELRTGTIEAHSRLSEHPEVWHELVSGLRVAVTRLVAEAQDALDAQR